MSKRILIADDEVGICKQISIYLKGRGFKTYEAYNGRQAFKIIKQNPVDLIILDVIMPEIDGFTVLKRLKSQPLYSQIPVIMLTQKSQPEYLAKGISYKADFYLPKPFTLENLMSFISLVLE